MRKMSNKFLITLAAICMTMTLNAQTALKKVYDESINPLEQIDQAVTGVLGVCVLQTLSQTTPQSVR